MDALGHVAPADIPVFVTRPKVWFRADSYQLFAPGEVQRLVAKYNAPHVASFAALPGAPRGVPVAAYAPLGGAPCLLYGAFGVYQSNQSAGYWNFLSSGQSTEVHIVDLVGATGGLAIVATWSSDVAPFFNTTWDGFLGNLNARREGVFFQQTGVSAAPSARKIQVGPVGAGNIRERCGAFPVVTATWVPSGAVPPATWCTVGRPSGSLASSASWRWAESIYWDYALTPAQVTARLVPYLVARYPGAIAAQVAGWTD